MILLKKILTFFIVSILVPFGCSGLRKLSLIEAAEVRLTIIEDTEFTYLENGHSTRELQGHITCINCLKELANQHNLSVNKNNPGYWSITSEEYHTLAKCDDYTCFGAKPRFFIMQIKKDFYCIPEESFIKKIISENSGFYFFDKQYDGGVIYNDEDPYAI